MDAVQPNHTPHLPLLGAALFAATIGVWTGRKIAYIPAAGLTLLAVGWMYWPAAEKPQKAPPPSGSPAKPPEAPPPSSSPAKPPEVPPAPPVPPVPPVPKAPPKSRLHFKLRTWCTEHSFDPSEVEKVLQTMGEKKQGVFSSADREFLFGFALGERRAGMAYLWDIQGEAAFKGGVKIGQFSGICFKLSEALTPAATCNTTDILVGMTEYEKCPSTVASVKHLRLLQNKKVEGLLFPMEYILLFGGKILATPTEQFDGTLADTEMTYLEAVTRMKNVAEALSALHKEGFVHHDIKPDNVVCKKEDTRLIDFDLLRQTKEHPDGIMGAPQYLPPVYLLSKGEYDRSEKLDVYSFGVTLWAILFHKNLKGLNWNDWDADFAIFQNNYTEFCDEEVSPPFQARFGAEWDERMNFQFNTPLIKMLDLEEGEEPDELDEYFGLVKATTPPKLIWESSSEGGFHDGHLPKSGPAGVPDLVALVRDCMNIDCKKRPKMSSVVKRLRKIEKMATKSD